MTIASTRIRRPLLLGAVALATTASMLAACLALMGLGLVRTGPQQAEAKTGAASGALAPR